METGIDDQAAYVQTTETPYTETQTYTEPVGTPYIEEYQTQTTAETDTYTEQPTGYETYTPDTQVRPTLDLGTTQQVEGILFMVQIAASRIPLTRSQVWAIYKGNLTLEVFEEEGWYKYRIPGFRLFSEANRAAVSSGVKDAWVVAKLDNQNLDLLQAKDMTRVLEKDVNSYGRSAIKNETDFYVQVAASRIRFDEEKLQQFCGSADLCREIIEEGWYKYQIYAGTEYSEAQSIKSQVGSGSFIVAYERGRKIKLFKAINK
jgi:hypothetical protein